MEPEEEVPPTEGGEKDKKSPDVDGGWAWVVFVAGFLQFLVSSGMFYSFSVFFVEFLEVFGESRAKTGWVYSTNSAVHMFAGPVTGFVIVRWGPRVAVILGGLFAGLGYFLTAFATDLNMVFITFGFVNAVGTSLNFSGWIVGLARFWNRHHALIVGIAMSGSGCGVFLLGPQMENIVDHFGWRGAMLLCAGMSLNFCVFGATIYSNLKNPEGTSTKDSAEMYGLLTEAIADDGPIINKDDFSSTTEGISSSTAVNINMRRKDKTLPDETPSLKSPRIFGRSVYLKELDQSDNKRNKLVRWLKLLIVPCTKRNTMAVSTTEDADENNSVKELLLSPKFWLIEASCFLSFMATTTVYAIFLDWTQWKGLSSSFSQALAGSGAGDLFGRIIAGALMGRGLPPLILFSGIQLLLAVAVTVAALASSGVQLIGAMVGFGIACGLQSVLYALLPSQLSKGVIMAKVLGYMLLVTGAGALAGPPIAGLLVDLTGSYDPVMIMCTGATAAAAVFNFAAHFSKKRHNSVPLCATS